MKEGDALKKGDKMAKKVNLSNLEANEKKKLGKVSFLSIFSVFIACVIIVGCFACSQNSSVQLNKEQQAEIDRIYWENEVVGTKWIVSTSDKNSGILDGQSVTLELEFANEKGVLCAYFTHSNVKLLTGELALVSSEGTIEFPDGTKWGAKFSEKNNTRYLTISCRNGDVYYTSNK